MRNKLKILVFAAAATVVASLALPAAVDANYRYGHRFRAGFGRSEYSHAVRHRFRHGYYGRGFRRGGFDGPRGHGGRYYRYDGAVRIRVNPRDVREEMEVYVDGGLAGVVNDFDGSFQRLRLSPGQHEIEVKLDGYQSLQTTIFVGRGGIYHIRGRLLPLEANPT